MSVNQTPAFVKHIRHTIDAFLGGKLSICQPEKGFRAGVDSVLLGASVPQTARSLLDLGAGSGVASLVAMAHNPNLEATLVEVEPEIAALAEHNVRENGFGARGRVVSVDVTAGGAARKAAGIKPDGYDVVIANPPYFDNGTLASQADRARARHMQAEALELWVKAAVSSAGGKGEIIFIHTAQALPALLAAFGGRVGDIGILPISPRPGIAASRVIVGGRKGSRAPISLYPPLALHGETGHDFLPEAKAVFLGETLFDWRNAAQAPK